MTTKLEGSHETVSDIALQAASWARSMKPRVGGKYSRCRVLH